MILILHEKDDVSTLKTAEWIKYISPDTQLLLVNEDNTIESVYFDINNDDIVIDFKGIGNINLKEVTNFWYRRGDFYIALNSKNDITNVEFDFLENEWKIVKNYIFYFLEKNSKNYCSYFKTDINKLVVLETAKRVIFNGPMGLFEDNKYAKGTRMLFKCLDKNKVKTIIGGGDSAAAVNKLGFSDSFYHVSTGGGTTMKYLESRSLVGIDVIEDKKVN